MKRKKWLWGALCLCYGGVALPMAASAADEIGYYEATASEEPIMERMSSP